jgi:hypothetical protein
MAVLSPPGKEMNILMCSVSSAELTQTRVSISKSIFFCIINW